MTADAKVGLLLGLFFIVIIAFLVNGLPNFIHEENPTPVDAMITTPTQADMELGRSVPEAVHQLYRSRETDPPQKTVVLGSPPSQVDVPESIPPDRQDNPLIVVPEVADVPKVRTHIVKSGETLPVIASIYYGEEHGNRRVVVQKLYEANTDVLKSPDRVFVDDKLVVPLTLDGLLNPSKKVVEAPDASNTLLKKFTHLLEHVGEEDSRSVSEYVVQEDDSLWSIAQQQLGNGNRYKEIARLNRIKDVDSVAVGSRLKLPAQ